MKELFFSFLCLLLFNSAYSQLGIRGGINVSNATLSLSGSSSDLDYKVGPHIGITYIFSINEDLKLSPGLLYNELGFNQDGFDGASTTILRYTELPMYFKYEIEVEDKGLFVQMGPYLAYLLSALFEGENVSGDFEKLDYGMNMGIGYDFENNLSIGLEYGLGLGNLVEGGSGAADVCSSDLRIYYNFSLG